MSSDPKHLCQNSRNQVFNIKFWMRHFNSPSMKPTMVISNHSAFGSFDLGPVKQSKKKKSKQTTKRYVDGSGKKRFSGTKSLKASQKLIYCSEIFPQVYLNFTPLIYKCNGFHNKYPSKNFQRNIYIFLGFNNQTAWMPSNRKSTKDLHLQICSQVCSFAAHVEEETPVHGNGSILQYALMKLVSIFHPLPIHD